MTGQDDADYTPETRRTLGRTEPEERRPPGTDWAWSDEYAERETLDRPVGSGDAGGMMLAGRYKVLRRLGEGGMGSVWLAEDTKLDNRRVAVKMLPAVLAGKKGSYRQVKQEALMAMKLAHPNIATVRAFEEDEGGSPFLVMDYIEGLGLDEILVEKGNLTEAETLKLLGPVAAALDYAHSQGVVHRDVKPGNVMVRQDGTPFVLDFGIAREIQETMTRVTGKFSSGTLLYMSPEQLRGRAPKAAQDVYSFAAMAYECLAGHPPFFRGAVEDQIKNEPPEELPEGVASEALRKGIMAGLAKLPEGRPGSCLGVLGMDETAKREREKREAEEARRKREEDALRARERARAEEAQRRQREEAERLVRERARAEEEERRRAAAALEAERAARKRAEEDAREARRKAQAEELEAQRAQEARGRAAGWAWFLAIVLVLGGLVAYGVWQQEHESAQAEVRSLQQESAAQRRAQQEAEARWKAEAEAQRKAQADAERKAEEARQELERQRAEAEAKAKAQQEAEARWKAEAERKAEQERQMKPSILLKATLNGREVAATVTEGLARSGLTTPVTVNLEVGGSYGFAAEYEAGGKKYAGRTTVMAKDRGVTAAAVVLEERPSGREGSHAGERMTVRVGAREVALRWCPADTFTMGSPEGEEGRDNGETQHRVTLTRGFWMGEMEVTQGLWREVMGENPSYFKSGDNYPVENVSWEDCQKFVQALNARHPQEGMRWALPTEAQWEYACRAGTGTAYFWGNALNGEKANCDGNYPCGTRVKGPCKEKTTPVGSYAANAWGLYDMHGNVWEWCADWFGAYPSGAVTDPQGPSTGSDRVDRGGSWINYARRCRSARRDCSDPGLRSSDLGLRVALLPDQ